MKRVTLHINNVHSAIIELSRGIKRWRVPKKHPISMFGTIIPYFGRYRLLFDMDWAELNWFDESPLFEVDIIKPELRPITTFDVSIIQDESVIATLYENTKMVIRGSGAIRDNQNWGEYKDSITSVEIQEGVTEIGRAAFAGCENLTEVIFPDSLQSIGDSAFGNCASLASLTLPDGLQSIGIRAFAGCTSLTEIVIPDSVTSIGGGAFASGNPDLILKPEVLEKPEGWSEMWNAYNWGGTFLTVWWGGVPPQQ